MKTPNTKGFTIAELMVAVAIMATALAAMGWVFKVSIDAQRMSTATNEISRKLRAITDQINSDFAGFRVDMPGAILQIPKRTSTIRPAMTADRIWFLANGDFQSMKQYGYNGKDKTVFGNMAQVTYAMSEEDTSTNVPDPLSTANKDRDQKYLLRRQVVFTSDTDWDAVTAANKDKIEYARSSSIQYVLKDIKSEPNNGDIEKMTEIEFDPNDGNDVPLVIAKGVENFRIELLQSSRTIDPNGALNWVDANDNEKISSYPSALKISFTLYSKTKINGKPLSKSFSHIVDLRQ